MSPFEYVIVLVSLILGLGITTILTGVAGWIRVGTRHSKVYYPYMIWIILVFVMHFHEWWESYSLMYYIHEWSLLFFLFLILYPIVLYLLANLMFPNQHTPDFDSRVYYLANWKKFIIALLGLVVLSFFQNVFLTGLPITSQFIQLILLVVPGSLLLRKHVPERVHLYLAIFLLVVMMASLVVNRELLTIKV